MISYAGGMPTFQELSSALSEFLESAKETKSLAWAGQALFMGPMNFHLPDEQGTKKGFMEAQNRLNATPVVWGGTEDDAIREMVDVLAQGQKAHARKRLLMVYVANKNRDLAIATLRLEQVERPSLRAANRYLAGVTHHITGRWIEVHFGIFCVEVHVIVVSGRGPSGGGGWLLEVPCESMGCASPWASLKPGIICA